MDCTSFYLIAVKIWEFARENGKEIGTLLSSSLTILFAWLSWHYSRLAYQRNQFSGKVAMNRAFGSFGIDDIREMFVFSFTNDGHRKGLIRSVYFELNKNHKLFFGLVPSNLFVPWSTLPVFPYELDEMGEISFSVYKHEFVKFIHQNLKSSKGLKLKYLCFTDNVGKVYKYKIRKKYWRELFL